MVFGTMAFTIQPGFYLFQVDIKTLKAPGQDVKYI